MALERQPGRLDLEGGADVEEADQLGAVQRRDPSAAMGLDHDEPVGGEPLKRSPKRVPRDAVALRELDLAQRSAGSDRAVEDRRTQRRGKLVDDRLPAQGLRAHVSRLEPATAGRGAPAP